MTWSSPEVKGTLPPGLRGHTANLIGAYDSVTRRQQQQRRRQQREQRACVAHRAVASDGVRVVAAARSWTRRPRLDPPSIPLLSVLRFLSPRPSSSSPRSAGSRIVLFGGYDGRGRSNDTFMLDTATLKWEHPPVNETTPAGRQRHTACLVSSKKMLVLGGFDGFKW